jgi:hypothetical protein
MPNLMLNKSKRAQVDVLEPATISTADAVTYTAAEMLGGLILRDPNGGARSDVTPSATLLVAAMPKEGRIADATFMCNLINTANAGETITVTAGDGVTLVPASVTVAQNENAQLLVRFTDVRHTSYAVTIYSMVSGG